MEAQSSLSQDAEETAVQALGHRLGLPRPLPYTPSWSAAADFLNLLVRHMRSYRPAQVVECGSGTSTLVLARCCQINGAGHVFSLEHEAHFAEATGAALADQGLAAWATVLYAPLRPWMLEGQAWPWYDLAALPAGGIDLLVVDGPPARSQPLARYPALPVLGPRLTPAAVVYLDDAGRPGEQEVLRRWQACMPQYRQELIPTQRGCARLQRDG